MTSSPADFRVKAAEALADPGLQKALGRMRTGFIASRQAAVDRLPEFEALREAAREARDAALQNLDVYLEQFESRVLDAGGRVHWCSTPAQAVETVEAICAGANARTVVKSKSMVTEEIGLNQHLERSGIDVVETDLGEYIIQLRREPPSHIIAPAIHLGADQVEEDFRRHHVGLPADRPLEKPADFVLEARGILRERFRRADVGITGANFLVAETGSVVVVTNEGNADLTRLLPRTHIVVAGIEKVVATLQDATVILRLLARSATGQETATYTTFASGPVGDGRSFHVVLLDNGRTGMLASPFADALRCVRCGACVNHCPVYGAVGGHAYGSVYSGPIGAVLTPFQLGLEEARHLPEASSFCRRCEEVCPVGVPLVRLMRQWREATFQQGIAPRPLRTGLSTWAFFASRPRLYRLITRLASWLLRLSGGRKSRLSRAPFARGWTAYRDLPVPETRPFTARPGERT